MSEGNKTVFSQVIFSSLFNACLMLKVFMLKVISDSDNHLPIFFYFSENSIPFSLTLSSEPILKFLQ